MKKMIISAVCLFSSLALVGCGGVSDSEANKSINMQLERVGSVMTSSTVENVNQVTPSDFLSNENNSKVLSQRNNSLYNTKNEKALKEEILQTTSRIKSYNQSNLKLGNDKAKAIKNLSQNINKYLNYLNNSKNDLKRSVNKIRNSDKLDNTNIESLNANFVELNSNLKEREAYLQNLLTSLQEVEAIYSSAQNTDSQTNTNRNSTSKNSSGQTFTPNIDTYRSNTQNTINDNSIQNSDLNNNTLNNNGYYTYNGYNNPYRPEVQYNSNNFNRAYNNYRYGYNGNGGYNNGFGYNGYGYGYNNPGFNTNRNTDTYAPFARNIDTYRYNQNNYLNRPIMTNQINQESDQINEDKLAQQEKQQDVKTKFKKKHLKNHNTEEKETISNNLHKDSITKENMLKNTESTQNRTLSNQISKPKRPISRPMTAPKIIKNDKNQGSKVI